MNETQTYFCAQQKRDFTQLSNRKITFCKNILYMTMIACVYLKMSCVSRSMCRPLMNRAESPGCRPSDPLKSYGERNINIPKYPVHIKP